jgi:hypothetical protein
MNDRPEENIDRLHAHEEQLRVESLAVIAKHEDLSDHWKVAQEAMNELGAWQDRARSAAGALDCNITIHKYLV